MTQNEKVLKYMREVGPITQLECTYELWCTRLAARIGNLKEMGYDIKSDWCTRTNMYGETKRFKKYWVNEEVNGQRLMI